MSQISTDPGQIQRQLYLLGYSVPLPTDGAPLVAMLLKDMQAALDRVKELEEANTKLEREDRTARASNARSKTELHALRTENNSLRAEVLNYTRDVDRIEREAREKEYTQGKRLDDLRMANLQVKAELAETQRKLGECQKRVEEQMSAKDPRGRIARIAMSSTLSPSMFNNRRASPDLPPQAIIDLVDLSSRRISALEKEVEYLETKLQSSTAELRSAQMEVKERDLELLRVNAEYEKRGPDDIGQNSLGDQVDYLHERVEALERENRDLRTQSTKERDDLHKRWIETENERVRLATEAATAKATSPEPERSSSSNSTELERLRTECANIKSLYSQTRDQLQELLRRTSRSSPDSQQPSSDLVDQLRKLDSSLKHAVDEVGEWRAKADDREHTIGDLMRQTSEYKMQHEQSSGELRACRMTLDGYSKDLDTLREAQANSQREADRLGDELAQAVRLRQAIEMSKDDYKRQLSKALGESEGHRSLVAHLQAEREALRVQVKAQFHLSQRLEQRLASLENLSSSDHRRTL
ncbi:hypothetical protein LPJ59_000219 [Coemansia sp. RSA 2399]|nr:hypothetical protein LPJ59_000219 [Coemansia sp. RSA 2399]KAJ1908293.1 hypothetical protein LPJ81_000204 [Coemansia sp. IMI 209127]